MHDISNIEQMFTDKMMTPGTYLVAFLKLSSKKHILEQKNMHNYSPEVLVSSLTIRTGMESANWQMAS